MKTIADLSIKQLNSLAHIAMLRLDRRVVFMADSPKEVFKEALKDTLSAYEMRVLLKLLPNLNIGQVPLINERDEPGVALVKATWIGINTFGLDRFFAGSTPNGYGKYKNEYIIDSLVPINLEGNFNHRGVEAKLAVDLYVGLLERFYSLEFRATRPCNDNILSSTRSNIGNYWDNIAVRRHLGKDVSKWAAHVEKHTGGKRG
ncbi:hypothetical protein pEaSNUABM37_00074 [Erwinia phage pEa_SNUABM_37]|nr:hypothetical protein pEaSNUABM37_00074 [Erwinia phage pEa_SNUABM_37]QXO10544.1 hypothetical protein pEaSNUABM48_00074 [Erwinia phage pEa_SNUABM_48]